MDAATITAPFWADLERHGDAVALRAATEALTYRQLAARVDGAASLLGEGRRLVLLRAANRVETVVWYLAALRGGHAVLVCADRDDQVAGLVAQYDPDWVVGPDGDAALRHHQPVHELHEDLALLLSTSGSTGSPKLVRLSGENIASNAGAIAEYLALTPDDRAITSLPLHYCYGLSVLHSHLAVGATVVLTESSVVDPCFWELARSAGVTGLAGVPHTFALLDRVGFEAALLPSLRYVTQAGGRLDPDDVVRWAAAGARDGWLLYVMYGQTEATARMAYLPPALAGRHPGAVGVAVPGGSFTIEPVPETDLPGHGEVVYRGPNVMLGYAETPADLALGRAVDELRTGDLGCITADGLLEISGRRNRFAKLFGLRIDLAAVEARLQAEAVTAMCASDDSRLYVVTTGEREVTAQIVRDVTGLGPSAVAVASVDDLPRLASGKPDHAAVTRLATAAESPPLRSGAGDVRALYARVLSLPDPGAIRGADTFVSLGGDSLSYVELSVALEDHLGHLPDGWHLCTIDALGGTTRTARSWLRRIDTSAVLRAVAIVLIVGNHVGTWLVPGGAHVLLAIAGFNLGRFSSTAGRVWPTVARIAVPSVCWIGLVAATTDGWGLTHALLVRSWVGPPDARWSYWFIETILALLVPVAAAYSVPAVRRLDRRRPFALPLAVGAVGLAIRFEVLDLPDQHLRLFRPQEVLWLFALGWAAARATSLRHRVLLAAGAGLATVDFFTNDLANVVLGAGVVVLVLVPRLPVPRVVAAPVASLAAASLHVYLVHWQVFPHLDAVPDVVATAVSLVVGVLAWRLTDRATDAGARALAHARSAFGRRTRPVSQPDLVDLAGAALR